MPPSPGFIGSDAWQGISERGTRVNTLVNNPTSLDSARALFLGTLEHMAREGP